MAVEISDRAFRSAYSFYWRLQEAFPDYIANSEAKCPSAWSAAPQFTELVALGPKILVPVLEKIALKPEDGQAVSLYNELEKNSEYKVDGNLEHQGIAIVEKNFTRSRAIRNAILDWAEYCEMVSHASSSTAYIGCDEYKNLVSFGAAVIPQLMLLYNKKELVSLFAYELFHRILWGYQTGQTTIDMKMQKDMWTEWFEKKKYDEAPY
ncbi:hypothetical protein QBC44DRAFT_374088 [Cladorrhinum sp. PSN332]|nr:hypothetical protein QBC44DRAFT_374088 [Cladorrhinum sp. PSN332]